MNNRYPIYIISKGRWESRHTSNTLERMNIPYNIVIEPQEFDQYASVIDSEKILVLPFANLGQGSIPVRNWVWEHSKGLGFERHWVLDDNINGFVRLNRNHRIPCDSNAIFRAAEDFTDRYTNIAFSGFNYRFFAEARNERIPPFYLNTRVYSMILVNNVLELRWRGFYNEDTDICLRVLKAGWCTILFNAFLGNKASTQTVKGGNTEEVYGKSDKRKEFVESLQKQHPDHVKMMWRYDRWHHNVNYRPFKRNKLKKKEGLEIAGGVNNYGMILKEVKDRS